MRLAAVSSTYDHIHWNIRDPVRSPRVKPMRGRLVVEWVTISEHRLLYVFLFLSLLVVLLDHVKDVVYSSRWNGQS
jgi:hypothetical protein